MNFLLPEHKRKWILWILQANEREEAEFSLVYRVLQRYGSFTVPIREITRTGIDFRSSTLVKKLLKSGFLRISKIEFELHPRIMTNRQELATELKNYYGPLHQSKLPVETPWPSSGFSNLPEECEQMASDDLDTSHLRRGAAEGEIIELRFANQALPPILIHGDFLQELPVFCWRKIQYYLSQLAGENSDFFSEKILSYKNLLLGRQRELIEGDLGQLQRRTDKELREESTRLILNRITITGDAGKQVISDLVSPENSYLLTRFSYNEIGDFDFLISLGILERLLLAAPKKRGVSTDDFLINVRDAVHLVISEDELKQLTHSFFPGTAGDELEKQYQAFKQKYVGLGAVHPLCVAFNSPDEGTLYLHHHNIESYLAKRGAHLQQAVQDNIEQRWRGMLEEHKFEEAMQNDRRFRELLHQTAVKLDPPLVSLLKNASLYRFLDDRPGVDGFPRRVREFRYDAPDRLFKLNRTQLFDKIYLQIHSSYTWFRALLFRLFHWLAWSVHQNQHASAPKHGKPKAEEKKGMSSEDILKQAGLDELEGRQKLQEIWTRLPADVLPREEIDRNIETDLNQFYADRPAVSLGALTMIVERNLGRILKKAPHLEGYGHGLREYITLKMSLVIAGRHDLRSKTEP